MFILSNWDEIVFGGGGGVSVGERLVSTDRAYCRYRFFVGDPLVKFTDKTNPNIPIKVESEFCSICYEAIVDKEGLPCGHNFCLGCLQGWAKHCSHTCHPAVCPVCRSSFRPGKLRPEAVVTRNELQIWTIEGMVRDLNVDCGKSITSASIFKKWSEKRRTWFWNAYTQVKDNFARRIVFLHLTKASFSHIIRASIDELKQIMENWEISVGFDGSEDIGECQRLVLLYWVDHLGPSANHRSLQRYSLRAVGL
jgi:hypothetical protein